MFVFIKKYLANLMVIVVVESLLTGCGLQSFLSGAKINQTHTAQFPESDNYNSQDVKEIQALLNDNLYAAQQEDIEQVMSQIHPDSPQFESTRLTMIVLFDLYDLEYEVNEMDIIEISDDQAKIRVNQTTKKVTGAEFRDNQVVAVHTLKKYQDQWKFFFTEIRSLEYLD